MTLRTISFGSQSISPQNRVVLRSSFIEGLAVNLADFFQSLTFGKSAITQFDEKGTRA
jgi:hypothetical protein